jgi:hypothetical protein
MIKTIIKLAIVALLANAVWRIGSAYLSFYRFKDSVGELAMHSKGKSIDELKNKVVELAGTYDEPIDADAISVRREDTHLIVEGSYKKRVLLAPGYEYAWPFSLNVDRMVLPPRSLNDLSSP